MPSKERKKTVPTQIFNELAAKNVRKSAKDYFIYFFTLMLSVCLFYSFNSISTQFASLGMEDKLNYLAFSSSILTAFSVIVCFVMGALVVYANRFLLRRRKKEMGIYATLGMERKDLNHLLMKETLRIGILSLIAGLVMGVFAAQILSLITAKIMGLNLASYHFMISPKSIVLSIIFFGILFGFVHIFNVKELKKMSLLDMLYADRKNETLLNERRGLDILLAIFSLGLIAAGYGVLFFTGDEGLFRALGLGGLLLILGTLCFFSSAFRIMTKLMKKKKVSYYRGLNMFTASQFSSQLKSVGKSSALIAILLFLSLSLTILGPGIGKFVMNGIEYADPYDASISYVAEYGEEPLADPQAYLEENGFKVTELADSYAGFWTYEASSPMLNFPKGDNASSAKAGNTEYSDEQAAANQTIIGLDDYNHLLSLQGKAPITLGANEFAISYAFPPLEDDLKAFAKNPEPLTLAGTTLTLAQNGLYHNAWENKNALVEEGTVIVPQSVAEGLKPVRWVLNFNFAENVADAHTKLYDNWFSASVEGFQLQAGQEVIVSIGADNLLTTYLGLYLGITFLITSGAVLALQQLSRSSDNAQRYLLLRKLGASQKEMKRSLVKQLRVYFGLPMLVAVIHSAVVVALVFRYFEGFALSIMLSIIGSAALLIFAVYGVYFIATYVGSRRIIRI